MRKLLMISIMLIGFIGNSMAQKVLTGTVTGEDKNPFAGVTVIVKGTSIGTSTLANGKFSLQVPEGAKTLTFSFIGMKTYEVAIGNQTSFDIVMLVDVGMLEEVVVIGYGTMKKKDLTGAVSSVKATLTENEKPQAVQDILRGNIPGLEVSLSPFAKGGGTLEIRGDNTLKTSSSPLIVLDGVIYQGDLEDINPNDIESIDVLKDASSSAVFGARASNGVILITSKKGKAGKMIINLNSSVGLATMATMADVYGPDNFIPWRQDVLRSMNYYNAATKDKLYIFDDPRHLPVGVTMNQWLNGTTGDTIAIWLNRLGFVSNEVENYKAGKSTDWLDMAFQNGLRQDHNLSMSGKKDEVTYYGSVGYNNNNGIIVGDQFKAIRSRINIEAKASDWLTVGFNTQFSNRDESNINASWGDAVYCPPWGSPLEDDGKTLRYWPTYGNFVNPIYDRSFQERRKVYNTLISNLYTNVKLPFGISYQLTFAPRFEWYNYMNHQSAFHFDWKAFGGQANREQSSIYSWQVDNMIKWNKTFNNIHQIDITLLANAEKYQSWQNSMSIQGFSPTDALGFHNMSAGTSTSIVISSNDQYSTGDALMGRLFYSLFNRYMVTLSLRRDGYSAFGLKNPRGTFPAVALGWAFTDEKFLKNNILTYGKLRFSWGENGNREIGRYDALSDMGIGKYPYVTTTGVVYQSNILYVNHMSNSNLKWEKARAINIGLDFSIKDDLFSGTFEVYKMRTLDLLVDRALPTITGFTSVTSNMGQVMNSGFEFTLNSRIINNKNFKWNSSFNFYTNNNKIIHLYGDMIDIKDANGNVIGQREADDQTNKWFIGHAVDEIWQPRILGVWQIGEETEAAKYGQFPGDFKIKDVDNNSKINNLDNEFLGNKVPRFRWNLRQEFNIYKNFDLSFMMYSNWGFYQTFNAAKNRSNFPDRVNSYVIPYWTPENPLNDYARLYSADGAAVFNVWRDASFIRLDEISLSYTVPSTLLQKANVNNLKFYINVKNVGFWVPHWKLWDPEDSYPTPRYFTIGINLTL